MNRPSTVFPERLYVFDALRGIAALAVVFWHWQHFFFQGAVPGLADIEQQPLYSTFFLFYRHGGDAVALFFCLSGFIFFWLFGRAVATGELTGWQFFRERFSRLYPLHLATFGAVALLQALYSRHTGSAFVYPFNDVYHGVLNLFLAPAWGLEQGWSYNAPAWSISVEVLLYLGFFLLWRYLPFPALAAALLIALATWVFPAQYKISLGGLSFFSGGVAYLWLTWLLQKLPLRTVAVGLALACVLAWIGLETGGFYARQWTFVVVFPLSIMTLVVWHRVLDPLARRLTWLGDISYASYLLHFPLQIIAAMLADKFLPGRQVFFQPWALLLFFAVLLGVSLACHHLFERPMQRWLRQRRRATASAVPIN
ncbi:acyltransferase [Pseudomonas sp. SZMC_28357]|uniref:acyltransferase family protein n=1 Tax=Pseudomonas sp. SZMC_28357 TaxID=3074380 RepID=UPI002872221F|nr:acyltransferase [Pseudomonas sp. SZMC_28357]MDR9754844.1 acyltransferase [Pseudomonas sp. SZMC_28357]